MSFARRSLPFAVLASVAAAFLTACQSPDIAAPRTPAVAPLLGTVLTSAPCAEIVGYRVDGNKSRAVGWYAEILAGFNVKNCSANPGNYSVQLVETNYLHPGVQEWDSSVIPIPALGSGQSFSAKWANEGAEPRSYYQCVVTVTDNATGAVLATQTLYVSTPTPKP